MTTHEMQLITVTDTRDMRYGEIFIIKESGIEVYNTTGLNDCPGELWDALDLEAPRSLHRGEATRGLH